MKKRSVMTLADDDHHTVEMYFDTGEGGGQVDGDQLRAGIALETPTRGGGEVRGRFV